MRIGIDASFLRPAARYTGMGVYTVGLVRGLAEIGTQHEISLLGYGPRPPEVPEAFTWHQIPLLKAGKASLWLSHQLALPALARTLSLDLLHVLGVNVRLSQPGVPFFSPCSLVVTVHDAIPVTYYGKEGPQLPWKLRWGYKLAISAVRRARKIITVSETSKTDILTALHLNHTKISVVYNGVTDLPQLTDDQANAELGKLGVIPPYLLYVGSFEPRKNVLGTIAAYAAACAQTDLPLLVLVVEPSSGYEASVRAKAADHGLERQLKWLHSLSDVALAALYKKATLFVYPSLYEGFGFTPLQAMQLGVPVIAGKAGAAEEVLGDGACLVDPRDQEALAGAIVRLYHDLEERQQLRTRGFARAAAYTWAHAARRTLEIYEDAGALRSTHGVPSPLIARQEDGREA